MRSNRLADRLAVLCCGLVATGLGLLLGVLVARLWPGPTLSGWTALAVAGGVGAGFAFVAGLVSEPLVSRLTAAIKRTAAREVKR